MSKHLAGRGGEGGPSCEQSTVDPLEGLQLMPSCMTEGEVRGAVKALWRLLSGPGAWDRLWDST